MIARSASPPATPKTLPRLMFRVVATQYASALVTSPTARFLVSLTRAPCLAPFFLPSPAGAALRDWNSVPVLVEGQGRGLRDIRGVPLPCVTSVSTTSNLGLPMLVTNLGPSTLTRVLEGLLRLRILQRRCAFFLEQSLLFPRR
jgi:hypothetical protein